LSSHLEYIGTDRIIAHQVFTEIVRLQPEKVFGIIAETMSLSGHEEDIKSFLCFDQCIGHPKGIPGMHIVVNIAMDQQQFASREYP
jgi:hypothetical protein